MNNKLMDVLDDIVKKTIHVYYCFDGSQEDFHCILNDISYYREFLLKKLKESWHVYIHKNQIELNMDMHTSYKLIIKGLLNESTIQFLRSDLKQLRKKR